MAAFLFRRLIGAIIVLFLVSVFTFVIFFVIPGGDPALRIAGKSPTPELIDQIREDWGFNDPLPVQYVQMMKRVFVGPFTATTDDDLESYTYRTNVIDQIRAG